jgi:hypothetical protein
MKRADYPQHPQALAIAKTLDQIKATGHGADDICEDWLIMVETMLEALPKHLAAAGLTGKLAEGDTEAHATEWKRIWAKYRLQDPARRWVYDCFSKAAGLLLDSTHDPATGELVYCELVGDLYESWGWPNRDAGQFFTPWNLCDFMAQMQGDIGELVWQRLIPLYLASPAGAMHCLFMTGMGAERLSDEQAQHVVDFARSLGSGILEIIGEKALAEFEPVKVCDPACGSGRMLIAAASHVPHWMNALGLVQYYGMDVDQTCARMARVNCMLYGLNGYGAKLAVELAGLPSVPRAEVPQAQPEPVAEPVDLPVGQLTLF